MRVFLLIAFFAAAVPARGAVLAGSSGLVQVRPEGSDRWRPAGKAPRALASGTALRTGFNARAEVSLDGGAALELGANTQASIGGRGQEPAVTVLFGSARVKARALQGRGVEMRTPTATARARSENAVWRAVVGGGGGEVFEAEAGMVAVEDARGAVLLLREGQRLAVDLAGLHEPETAPPPAVARVEAFADRMRRELDLNLEADDAQRLVASEARRSEFELGRVLTDSSGARVRAEEFVVRSAATGFTIVSLSSRRGNGLSYYSWSGTFDRALPTDLSGVYAILSGSVGSAAPWTLTSYTATLSNGTDSLVARGTGGHQVDLNANADPNDDVSSVYDPATDSFVPATGRAAYLSLFDDYGVYANGVLKNGTSGTNIQSPHDATDLTVITENTTFPNPDAARRIVYDSYGDGSFLQKDERSIGVGGGVAGSAAFGGATSGPGAQSGFLHSSFEQIVTASGFSRPVDVLVSARILVETGALP